MKFTIRDFLEITNADDRFIVNIKKEGKRIFFGYENEIPDDIMSLKIRKIYIDWASEALGINVCDNAEEGSVYV